MADEKCPRCGNKSKVLIQRPRACCSDDACCLPKWLWLEWQAMKDENTKLLRDHEAILKDVKAGGE